MKINIDQQNVFFCSDPHYHHQGLIKGTSRWVDRENCRDFKTLEDHNHTLVDNINNKVEWNDILFCLGDWSFGSYNGENVSKVKEFRDRLNCQDIHLILGNHDQEIRDNIQNVQSLFSSISYYKELYIIEPSKEQGIKAFKQFITMMHYPIRSWNKMRKGAWMLHGHCHNNLPDLQVNNKKLKTMDIGFDTNKNFEPYSYFEIKNIMKKRYIITEDHH